MARKNRTPEENARREKIRELLQMANIDSCCFAHKLRKPFTQSAKKKKRLSGPFKTS